MMSRSQRCLDVGVGGCVTPSRVGTAVARLGTTVREHTHTLYRINRTPPVVRSCIRLRYMHDCFTVQRALVAAPTHKSIE